MTIADILNLLNYCCCYCSYVLLLLGYKHIFCTCTCLIISAVGDSRTKINGWIVAEKWVSALGQAELTFKKPLALRPALKWSGHVQEPICPIQLSAPRSVGKGLRPFCSRAKPCNALLWMREQPRMLSDTPTWKLNLESSPLEDHYPLRNGVLVV